jgi:hypothetical protein
VTLAPQVKRVEVFSRGQIVVRGSTDGKVSLAVRQKTRAASEAEATRIFGPRSVLVPFKAQGVVLRFEMYPPPSSTVITEIEIAIPRSMPVVWINNATGSVEAYDLDGSLRVDAVGGGPITVDRIRGDVGTYTSVGTIKLGTIGGSVECRTGGGMIVVLNAAGSANCASGGGDIEVKSVGGPLQVSTEGGNIHVEKAGATVRAKTLEGQVDVVEARGTVIADSAAGGVQVRGGSGALNISAMLGNIVAELLGTRFVNSSLTTGAGDITVSIPEGLGLRVRAQNASGITPRIVSDFPELQVRSLALRAPGQMGSEWMGQGAVYGGGPVLDLNTNGGVIYLRRAKQ